MVVRWLSQIDWGDQKTEQKGTKFQAPHPTSIENPITNVQTIGPLNLK
jgi:hypothetical protein